MKLALCFLVTFVYVGYLSHGRCQDVISTSNGQTQTAKIDDSQLIAPLTLGWLNSHCLSADGQTIPSERVIQSLPVEGFQERIRSGTVQSTCSTLSGSDNAHMYKLRASGLGDVWVYYPVRSLLGVQPFQTRLYPTLTEAIKGENKALYTLDFQSAVNISNSAAIQEINVYNADPRKFALQISNDVAALTIKQNDAAAWHAAEAEDAAKKKEDDAKWAEEQAKTKEREARSAEIYALKQEIEQLKQKLSHDTQTQRMTDEGLIQSKQAVIDAKRALNNLK